MPGYDQAHVKLTPDGALEVEAGIPTIGQGLETTLAQIAHQMTGVPFADIRVTLGDTATTPFSTGAYASRGIVMAGGAVSRASDVVAARIKAIAAHLMQADPANVTFADGRIHAGASSIGFADVGRAWYMRPDQLPDGVDTAGLERPKATSPPPTMAFSPSPVMPPRSRWMLRPDWWKSSTTASPRIVAGW